MRREQESLINQARVKKAHKEAPQLEVDREVKEQRKGKWSTVRGKKDQKETHKAEQKLRGVSIIGDVRAGAQREFHCSIATPASKSYRSVISPSTLCSLLLQLCVCVYVCVQMCVVKIRNWVKKVFLPSKLITPPSIYCHTLFFSSGSHSNIHLKQYLRQQPYKQLGTPLHWGGHGNSACLLLEGPMFVPHHSSFSLGDNPGNSSLQTDFVKKAASWSSQSARTPQDLPTYNIVTGSVALRKCRVAATHMHICKIHLNSCLI